MEALVLLARLVLACVFAVSGAAKLLDRSGTRQAVAAFGLPRRVVEPVALLLPWVEILLSALLLARASGRPASAAALLLLLAFSVTIAWSLAHGRHPSCQCFGRIGASDVSARTLARNAVLVVAAGVGTTGPATSLLSYGGGAGAAGTVAVVALAVAAAVVALDALGSARAQRQRDAAAGATFAQGLGRADEPAPDFVLDDVDGSEVALSDLLAPGLPLVLVFMSTGCGPCRALDPAVTRWAVAYRDRLRVAVLLSGSAEHAREQHGDAADLTVLLDADATTRSAYGVSYTPSAVLVDSAGRLASPPAVGEGLIRRLLAAALAGVAFDAEAAPAEDGRPVAELTLRSAPGPRGTVTAHLVDDAVVLVDEASGASVALDPIGAVVWTCLDGSSSLSDIVDDLAVAYGAQVDVVAADVMELARSLGRNGMLQDVAAEWPEFDVERPADQADGEELAATRR